MSRHNGVPIDQVTAALPNGAVLDRHEPGGRPMIIAADFDGDGRLEAAAAFRMNGQGGIVTLRQEEYGAWVKTAKLTGPGYRISTLQAAPVTTEDKMNLLVGWQIGSIWSELRIHEEQGTGQWNELLQDTVTFTYMEALPAMGGSRSALALWMHDTGEAYQVEVMRFESGRLVASPELYPVYYPKVVRYYEHMVRQFPDYRFYRDYLEDARKKAGLLPTETVRAFPERSGNLYPAAVKQIGGTRWGYINERGEMVIRPTYDSAGEFQSNGLAVVGVKGRSGAIDRSGAMRIQPVFEMIGEFSEGRAVAIDKQGFHIIDERGDIVTARPYSYIGSFSEDRAVAYQSTSDGVSKYGYLDRQGREVIPLQYVEAGDFNEGRAVAKRKEKEYVLLDRGGRVLSTYPYAFVGGYGDGLLPFRKETDSKLGYIDEQGTVRIEPAYSVALPFQDGRAVVNASEDYSNLYGLLDRSGKLVLPTKYNDVMQLGERRVAVGTAIAAGQPYYGSRYAIADDDGRLLTDTRYYNVGDYKDGLASVNDGRQTYFIDRTGRKAEGWPSVQGSGTLTWMKPLIQANVDQRLFYLNTRGEVVWKPSGHIPLRPPYAVLEQKYMPNKDYLVYYPQVSGMKDQTIQERVNARLKKLAAVKPVGSGQLDYSYTGDFEVTFFRDRLVVLELVGYEFPFGAAHGMPSRIYAHIDLVSGQFYELSDLFKPGSDYVKVLSEIVGKQIKNDPQYDYVFPDSYKGISADQPFYVTEHALHLYFNPYEIAPYAAGFPTFTIPFAELKSIIAEQGAFWRSFH
ncbi:WG repeat-containing protein [Paenibacillus sp. YYML68]|uniref:WG repeat-containing protein n=1 Tax=Paenibacillus sp. YYML68 TaxID=2909250 RepID=UPI00248F600C|nr:WG repeat-containing protein [Paenibacillus sp. YYML68]